MAASPKVLPALDEMTPSQHRPAAVSEAPFSTSNVEFASSISSLYLPSPFAAACFYADLSRHFSPDRADQFAARHQGGFPTLGLQLRGRQRHRDLLVVQVHLVAADQPLVRDHVVMSKGGNHPTRATTLQPLASADAYVRRRSSNSQWPGAPALCDALSVNAAQDQRLARAAHGRRLPRM